MKATHGYLLHPSIPQCNADTLVCDVATGTGTWLVDLAKDLPSSALHGFDVNIAQVPPKEWLPSNVSFGTLDIFKPIPENLIGKYDVVHVQLLLCVVQDHELQSVIRRLSKLLKPGGCLQWQEVDFDGAKFHKTHDSLSDEKLRGLMAYQRNLGSEDPRLNPKWVDSLADAFREAGLDVVGDDRKHSTGTYMPIVTDIVLMTFYEMTPQMEPGPGNEFRRVIQEAADEVAKAKRGVAVTVEYRIVVGQKKA